MRHPKPSIDKISLKSTGLELHSNLPGSNELKCPQAYFPMAVSHIPWSSVMVHLVTHNSPTPYKIPHPSPAHLILS